MESDGKVEEGDKVRVVFIEIWTTLLNLKVLYWEEVDIEENQALWILLEGWKLIKQKGDPVGVFFYY